MLDTAPTRPASPTARGRLPGEPVAIVDIGSNSVRLVTYESQSRAPTPTFNEKALVRPRQGVAMTGLLPEDGVLKALAALQRFRVLCDTMGIRDIRASRPPRCATRRTGRNFSIARKACSGARSSS